MRFYLHYEGVPEFTKVVRASDTTMREAVAGFVAEYNLRHEGAVQLEATAMCVLNGRRKQIPFDSKVCDVLHDREDAYIVWIQPSAALADDARKQLQNMTVQPETKPAAAEGPSQERMDDQATAAIKRADAAVAARDLRSAEEIYRRVLTIYPRSVDVLEKLARLWMAAGKADHSVQYARTAVKSAPRSSRALQLLGEACS